VPKKVMATKKPTNLPSWAWVKSLVAAAVIVCGQVPTQASAECELWEPLTFADLDWGSARLHTGIASYIVREGYGCEVDSIPGGTLDSFSRLSVGGVDVMMEVWKENFLESWERAQVAGQVIDAGVNFAESVQGWVVPRYLIEGDDRRGIKPLAPDLRSVHDLARYSHLFADTPGAKTGVFMNCVPTWSCEPINTIKLKIYGLNQHFINRHPSSGDGLADYISARYREGLPFLAYYWGPTWVMGTYDLVMLEEPAYDELAWQNLVASQNAKQATAFPVSAVHKGVNFTLELEAPELLEFLEKYRMPSSLISDMLGVWHKNNQSRDEIVRHFLTTKPDIWKAWVPDRVARRVEQSLGDSDKTRSSPKSP
jgi:glycine betaine/proline transport system substrate-binding protein